MTEVTLIVGAVLFLAYANGANDNAKGVATLLGSETVGYRTAIAWATATTLVGSMAALMLASGLLESFKGRGLVPDAITRDPAFLLAICLGGGITVILATRLGLPVSTTHALTGALVGAGLVAAGAQVDLGRLGAGFLGPLILGPVLAAGITMVAYPLLRRLRLWLRVRKTTCLCVGTQTIMLPTLVPPSPDRVEAALRLVPEGHVVTATMSTPARCLDTYEGQLLGLCAARVLDALHFASAGIVGFARGLNDTPKIVAMLLAAGALAPGHAFGAVALAIALGGLLGARRVARTMAHEITAMNAGQGFTANAATGLVVIVASLVGLPVSTTHASCGALFGIGVVTGEAHWRTIGSIVVAWVTTLPLGAAMAAATLGLLRWVA